MVHPENLRILSRGTEITLLTCRHLILLKQEGSKEKLASILIALNSSDFHLHRFDVILLIYACLYNAADVALVEFHYAVNSYFDEEND